MSSSLQAFYDFHEKALRLERQGNKLIQLHVGATGLPVPEVALAVLKNVSSGARGYGSSAGLETLRQLAAEREGCEPENIVVGPGSKFLIFALMQIFRRARKTIAIPQPAWPAYELIARELDIEVSSIPSTYENHWQIGTLPSEEIGMLILCNPLNPTSTCYEPALMQQVKAECERRGITLIIDEAYRDIAFSPISSLDTIRVRSFSKEFNFEGLRLGYVVAPVEVARELIRFMQITITCVSTIIQEMGCQCLTQRDFILTHHRDLWKTRLSVLGEELTRGGFEFCLPQAGMYIFARHPKLRNADQFVMALLEHGVAIAPGSAFGPFPDFVRISASEEPGVLVQAIETMGKVITQL